MSKRIELDDRLSTALRGQLQNDGTVIVPDKSAKSRHGSRCSSKQASRQTSRQTSRQPSRQPSPTGSIKSIQSKQRAISPESNGHSCYSSCQPSRRETPQASRQPSRQVSPQASRQPSRRETPQASRQPSRQPSRRVSPQASRQPSRAPSPDRLSSASIKQIKQAYESGLNQQSVVEVPTRESLAELKRSIDERQLLVDSYEKEMERMTSAYTKRRRQIVESCPGQGQCEPYLMISVYHPKDGDFFFQAPCNLNRSNNFKMTIGNVSIEHEN